MAPQQGSGSASYSPGQLHYDIARGKIICFIIKVLRKFTVFLSNKIALAGICVCKSFKNLFTLTGGGITRSKRLG